MCFVPIFIIVQLPSVSSFNKRICYVNNNNNTEQRRGASIESLSLSLSSKDAMYSCLCGSGDVLSLEDVGDGAISIPRSGPQHDER